jgi:hypothetical protein
MKTFHTVARFQSTTIEWRNLCREGSSPKKLQRGWLIAVRLLMAVQPHGAGVITPRMRAFSSISFPKFGLHPAGRGPGLLCRYYWYRTSSEKEPISKWSLNHRAKVVPEGSAKYDAPETALWFDARIPGKKGMRLVALRETLRFSVANLEKITQPSQWCQRRTEPNLEKFHRISSQITLMLGTFGWLVYQTLV